MTAAEFTARLEPVREQLVAVVADAMQARAAAAVAAIDWQAVAREAFGEIGSLPWSLDPDDLGNFASEISQAIERELEGD